MSLVKSKNSDLEALARDEKAGALVMAARLSVRKGQPDKAREELKQAFAISPGDAAAIEILGDIYMAEGEQEKAVVLFQRALERFPNHAAFEEKLAICHLDLAEMESDKIARALVLEEGDKDKSLELKPAKAASLSLFLPGAGQFYNDEPEKGTIFAAVGLVALLGWSWLLASGIRTKQQAAAVPGGGQVGTALGTLGGFWASIFWLMLLIWLGAVAWSIADAVWSARRFNEARKRSLGL